MKLCRVGRWLIPPLLLGACSEIVEIESANQNSRVAYVVIHATSEDFAESVRLLTTRTENPVSSHYLIPAANDPSYDRRRLLLHQFVDEERRAWHAGPSYWAGETALNDRSIGIEIVNEFNCEAVETPPGGEPAMPQCEFLPYEEAQIEMLIELLRGIQRRHPEIDPVNIVAHSDISITRRSDPGALFPWQRLYEAGFGAWYDEEAKLRHEAAFAGQPPSVDMLQAALPMLGYEVEATGELDFQTRAAVRALQLRFRPGDYSGEPDIETLAILWSLLEKYRPGEALPSAGDQAVAGIL